MKDNMEKDCKSRRGIALVIVLGFLAILTILAVGFAISMRTERLVAGTYKHAAVGRELARAALARAMDAIDEDLDRSGHWLPHWTTMRAHTNHPTGYDFSYDELDTVGAPAFNFMPHIPQLASQGTAPSSSGPQIGSVGDVILNLTDRSYGQVFRSGRGTSYLVGGMLNIWEAGDRYRRITEEPEWNEVHTDGRLVGRYAFNVINASGLLDANIIGTNRMYGAHPSELACLELTEFGENQPRLDAFVNRRDNDAHAALRYETLEELFFLNYNNQGLFDPPHTHFPQHMFSFSYHPQGPRNQRLQGYDYLFLAQGTETDEIPFVSASPWYLTNETAVLERIDIGGSNPLMSTNIYREAVIRGLEGALTTNYPGMQGGGHSERMAGWAFTNMMHYVSGSREPRHPDGEGPTGAAVPMLNEFAVEHTLRIRVGGQPPIEPGFPWTVGNVRYMVENRVHLEAWYPFDEPRFKSSAPDTYILPLGGPYEFRCTISIENVTGDIPDGFLPYSHSDSSEPFGTSFNPNANTFHTRGETTSDFNPGIRDPDWVNLGPPGRALVEYSFDVVLDDAHIVEIIDINTETEVDRVHGELRHSVTNRMEIPIPESEALGPEVRAEIRRSFEAIDPRWNWDAANELMWLSRDGHSIGSINQATTQYRTSGDNSWILGAGSVSDLPPVDEDTLMYVAHRPMRTAGELGFINYYPWRSFRLYDTATHQQHPVLDYFWVARATDDWPERGYMNPNSRKTDALATLFYDLPGVSWDDARVLANAVRDHTEDHPITRPSHIGQVPNLFQTVPAANPGRRRWENEARVRNTVDMMSVRGQVYTVAIAGQALEARGGRTNIVSDQRGVAIVWRDTIPDNEDVYRSFVRYFRWLTD